ncbi:MAG: crossover junction endodeoxyribonuclease RuvC, partial [Bdellovibrionales bacterium]|nr:crossover junction endodeoxyribonuclease RuvC [Bdellovibrionales bacterium]
MRIIGIDPGSRITGIGVLDISCGDVKHVYHGIIQGDDRQKFLDRMLVIGSELGEILRNFQPNVVSM